MDKLKQLADLVFVKAQQINITAIRDHEGIWQKHILDSLELTKVLFWKELIEKDKVQKLLDLGTGGGFPGLPLAINYPNIKFTLLDGTRKKIEAVKEFSKNLELQNVEALWGRAEELVSNPKYNRQYDIVVSRAVAYLPDLIALSKDFIKPTGYLIFYKNFSEEEIEAGKSKIKEFDLKIKQIHEYGLTDVDSKRMIILIGK